MFCLSVLLSISMIALSAYSLMIREKKLRKTFHEQSFEVEC